MSERLTSLDSLPDTVQVPDYDRETVRPGIVHLGVGAFFKSHLATYTEDALSATKGDWSIIGISLRSPHAGDNLNPQNGLFTVLERQGMDTKARVVGCLSKVICAPQHPNKAMVALTAPTTKIVSLTITEKAYITDEPDSAIGYLVEALRQRRDKSVPPFTVLCCDNLPNNGTFVRSRVLEYAVRVDAGLRDWIAKTTSFPSTMVDRITPASTDQTLALAQKLTGKTDLAAVETEPFKQWVIEDNFPQGRPAWEAGGALFVDDVAPYEKMKLRMLNGAHSMIAYSGYVAGHKYVRDVMQDPYLSQKVEDHLQAATQTLTSLPGIDFNAYAKELINRFRNPAIAHQTYQIAMDGTQKLPQRLLDPAVGALNAGQDITPFAFAVANWMRYCLGEMPDGTKYDLRDPRERKIKEALSGDELSATNIVQTLQGLPGLFPDELRENSKWNRTVLRALLDIIEPI